MIPNIPSYTLCLLSYLVQEIHAATTCIPTTNMHTHTQKSPAAAAGKNRDFKTNDSFEFGESGSNFLLLGCPDIQTPAIHIPNCKLQIAQSLVPNSLQELVIIMDCVCII
jgi:hypothetical protein